MADNFVTGQAGGGGNVTFRADDVAGILYQYVKLDLGGDGATVNAIANDGNLAGLPTTPRVARLKVLGSGPVTNNGTKYKLKASIGSVITFTNVARYTGGHGLIRGVTLTDLDRQRPGLDLVLFSATPVASVTDNTTFTPSNADLANYVATIRLPEIGGWSDFATNAACSIDDLAVSYFCAAQSLFGVLVVRDLPAPTFTGIANLTVTLRVDLD